VLWMRVTKDGYISPDEARKIYEEIEDVIGH